MFPPQPQTFSAQAKLVATSQGAFPPELIIISITTRTARRRKRRKRMSEEKRARERWEEGIEKRKKMIKRYQEAQFTELICHTPIS